MSPSCPAEPIPWLFLAPVIALIVVLIAIFIVTVVRDRRRCPLCGLRAPRLACGVSTCPSSGEIGQ